MDFIASGLVGNRDQDDSSLVFQIVTLWPGFDNSASLPHFYVQRLRPYSKRVSSQRIDMRGALRTRRMPIFNAAWTGIE